MRNKCMFFVIPLLMWSCTHGATSPPIEDMRYMAGGDPLEAYTSLIYKHSKQKADNSSLVTVRTCAFDEGGMTKVDLGNLLNTNYNQARQCWDRLLDYPRSDERFFVEGTEEYNTWANFWNDRQDMLAILGI